MKTKLILYSLLLIIFSAQLQAQNRTIVNASNAEISDNLDLRAVASIFGDSENIQDFERRLNDPQVQISNLDLNNDDQVDYLRVLETVEQRTHLIVIQAVLDRDVYQDVATIDVEKDRSNNIHIQVVGNSFMYGQNYIYEPVYFNTPIIYNTFWTPNYRPYYSAWNWNYYPSYYNTWNPFPVFRYRNNINICFTNNNYYNYVNQRRSDHAVVLYNARRSNGYERLHPEYSFSRRNANVNNRFELVQGRISRNEVGYRDRNAAAIRDYVPGNRSSRETAVQNRTSSRAYSESRSNRTTENVSPRINSTTTNSRNRSNSSIGVSPTKRESTTDYSRNRENSSRNNSSVSIDRNQSNSQNRTRQSSEGSTQRTQSTRDYSKNRNSQATEGSVQRTQSTRDYSQNRNSQAT
ncbi:MAG: hypothetical protein I4O51_03245, partial [Flavobacterium micromati]|nr:hypothetical protein [Flavobacterium micromati]